MKLATAGALAAMLFALGAAPAFAQAGPNSGNTPSAQMNSSSMGRTEGARRPMRHRMKRHGMKRRHRMRAM